jgi:hypothetical protein
MIANQEIRETPETSAENLLAFQLSNKVISNTKAMHMVGIADS